MCGGQKAHRAFNQTGSGRPQASAMGITVATGSISRVLSSTVIYLAAALPLRSSHLLGSSRASLASSAVLLRIEFTAMDASTPSGALLPHLSTLTSDEAVFLCCTFPEVAFGGRYPLSLPCGARTFLMRGLSTLRTRLSDPVAGLFYFILKRMSNELQIPSRVSIII